MATLSGTRVKVEVEPAAELGLELVTAPEAEPEGEGEGEGEGEKHLVPLWRAMTVLISSILLVGLLASCIVTFCSTFTIQQPSTTQY